MLPAGRQIEITGDLDQPKTAPKRNNSAAHTKLKKQIKNTLEKRGLWVIDLQISGVLRHINGGFQVTGNPVKGFPDLLIIAHDGLTAWLEVKTGAGVPSKLQKSRLDRLSALGHTAGVVRSLEQAIAVLTHADII